MSRFSSAVRRLSTRAGAHDALHKPAQGRLNAFSNFGSNPGHLDAWIHVPPNAGKGAPLVVVLHGCTQTAADYDRGAGWSTVADEHGFVLLLPEQTRANNPNLCFNWFCPRDARRGRGETLSIVQMIEAVHERHGTDSKRVFITGLSAGGAMAAVMLSSYPEVFEGGAVIAGLPFGTANNVPQALERMRGREMPDAAELGRLVRSASDFAGPWPALSVWHGTNDATVDPVNGRAVVDQWRELHSAAQRPSRTEKVGDHTRHIWTDETGREIIEEYLVSGMPHGTPLSTSEPESAEVAGPHMLEAGISSTRLITRFWGVETEVRDRKPRAAPAKRPLPRRQARAKAARSAERPPTGLSAIGETIERALRAAGLLR